MCTYHFACLSSYLSMLPRSNSCPTKCAGVALHQPRVACHVIDCAVRHQILLYHMWLADMFNPCFVRSGMRLQLCQART